MLLRLGQVLDEPVLPLLRPLPFGDIAQNDSQEVLVVDTDMRDGGLDGKFLSIGSQAEQRAGSSHRTGRHLCQGEVAHMTVVRLSEPFRDEPVEWLSDHVGGLAEKHGFCSSVEDHHALPLIHSDDGIHRRRDDPLKLRLMGRQLLLGPFAIADVQKRRSPMGDVPWLLVNRETLEIDPARGAGLFPKLHLTGLSRACLQDLLTMPVKRTLITRCNEARERLSDQLPPVDAEQFSGPQIGLHNLALGIQREMAGRGKIVEVHIAVTGRFELQLSPTEFVIL